MNGWTPNFDLDRAWGEAGEEIVRELSRKTVEVKRKSRIDDFLYVELEQDPGGLGLWKPSGLSTTEADLWAFVIADTAIVIFLPADLLRGAIQAGEGRPVHECDGDNPTRGRLLRISRLTTFTACQHQGFGHA